MVIVLITPIGIQVVYIKIIGTEITCNIMILHYYRVRTSVNSLYHNTPFLKKIHSKYVEKILIITIIYVENTENEKCFLSKRLEN